MKARVMDILTDKDGNRHERPCSYFNNFRDSVRGWHIIFMAMMTLFIGLVGWSLHAASRLSERMGEVEVRYMIHEERWDRLARDISEINELLKSINERTRR